MAPSKDVSVVGLYILDILGRPVERIPERGNVEFIEEIRLTVAGTAGGTVVDCAKLGLRSRAVGVVGDDEKADFVLATLQGYGIDTKHLRRIQGVPTSATILNVRPNGDRPALHVRGASDHFYIAEADYPEILDAKFVHVGGTGLLRKLDGAPTLALLKAARQAGCITTFDLIAATPETIALVEPLLTYVDWFMPSIEEARDLSGRSDPADIAAFFLDRGAGHVVFTMGGEGSYAAGREGRIRVPAFEVSGTRHHRLRRCLLRRLHRGPQPWLGHRNLCPLRLRGGGPRGHVAWQRCRHPQLRGHA